MDHITNVVKYKGSFNIPTPGIVSEVIISCNYCVKATGNCSHHQALAHKSKTSVFQIHVLQNMAQIRYYNVTLPKPYGCANYQTQTNPQIHTNYYELHPLLCVSCLLRLPAISTVGFRQ